MYWDAESPYPSSISHLEIYIREFREWERRMPPLVMVQTTLPQVDGAHVLLKLYQSEIDYP